MKLKRDQLVNVYKKVPLWRKTLFIKIGRTCEDWHPICVRSFHYGVHVLDEVFFIKYFIVITVIVQFKVRGGIVSGCTWSRN